MPNRRYTLALDVGATSIGWCATELNARGEPCGLIRLGVRVFPEGRDPQKGTSLAVDRRVARQARRRRDRFLQRQKRLITALVAAGLFPADREQRKALEHLDPYALRALAATAQALPPYELGRALFHLNQRRGFRSTRRPGGEGDAAEEGKIKTGISALAAQIEASGLPSLGAWLAARHAAKQPVRARLSGTGAKANYDFYPSRELAQAEFDTIRECQGPHHPSVTPAQWDHIRGVIFHQRRLRPVDPGKCTLQPGEPRAPWALPLAQRFRILQEVNNLRILREDFSKDPLPATGREAMLAALMNHKDRKFDQLLKAAKLPPDTKLNLADEKRDRLDGDATAASMADKKRFGPLWRALPPDTQAEVVTRLLDENAETDELVGWLGERFGLSAEAAGAVAAASLPDGHCRLSAAALARIVPEMEKGLRYDEAVVAAGYDHHSDLRADGAGLDRLPFYCEVPALEHFLSFGSGKETDKDPFRRIGRIANPTVHIGLNQIRTVVNDIIHEYGKPDSIIVELARNLSRSAEDRRKVQREQAENQKNNDRRRQQLRALGVDPTPDMVMRLRLWEELPIDGVMRKCVYTGENIGVERLLHGDVDIDHILPYSRTLDDGVGNRIVCVRRANRDKRNLSPVEAFSHSPTGYDWAEIQARAALLPANRRWRFAADAMGRFDDQERFLDRHLNDTRYLSRVAKLYLSCLFDEKRQGTLKVRAVPGTLVGLLRRKWGLNELLSVNGHKNRDDHRHHALDAAIISIIDQGTVQMVQMAAKKAADQHLDRLLDDLSPRHNWFRPHLEDRLARIVVSVKPDHGIAGRLHEETAYGIINRPEHWRGHTLVYRKPLGSLTAGEVERIRDTALRETLKSHIAAEVLAGNDIKAAVESFRNRDDHAWHQLRHVRLTKPEANFERIGNRRTGIPYKAVVPGENLCVDIVPDAKGRWTGRATTLFDASRQASHHGGTLPPPAPDVVMRLYKGDMLRLDVERPDGTVTPEVMRVHILDLANNRVRLAPHNEGGKLQERHDRTAKGGDHFRWTIISFDVLRKRRARKVVVTPSGRLRDPGPHPEG
ncbi:type II CRISPR RNA-guided endonuclease Cas9 [Niveispirillum sp.]|uniref:type II CRISPR RNA-guided endonuclease Cas9 n=1 Tax=Niveispirillum sp. TaxID=1917217 RepID=UPI001B77464B|nr:type II CRISPR RNA-guided endonuclease Cas9 [Niveispirillum sp.]MBP7338607.1 type II CRISPR RNA-guided endonuclease Cas9 [Niveispirillum sp.]